MADNEADDLPVRWKKLKVSSGIIASVLVPLAIALVGHAVNSTIKENELGLRYVELAVGVLREQPRAETENLRKWAIEIINNYAAVKLTDSAKAELKQEKLPRVSGLTAKNYSIPQEPRDISVIVISDTYTPSLDATINYLEQPDARGSYHYLIGTDGKVSKLVDEEYIAWHAGRSKWKDLVGLNKYSIGIGLIHIASKDGSNFLGLPAEHPAVGPEYPKEQIASLIALLIDICSRRAIAVENIVTKQDVAPGRKLTDLAGAKMEEIRRTVARQIQIESNQ